MALIIFAIISLVLGVGAILLGTLTQTYIIAFFGLCIFVVFSVVLIEAIKEKQWFDELEKESNYF